MSKNFALIGAAGYIAPRHMKAIKDTGNKLIAAMDPNDSVGIIDSYFPDASFFTQIETFDRHMYKLSSTPEKIDYVSICSPNYLHDPHIRMSMRNGADVICEKPLVINPDNIKYLQDLEKETGRKVNTVLQLRYHDKIIELKNNFANKSPDKPIKLQYITSRGNWYFQSWKADKAKSGGLAANIGIHFFDMLSWVFGDPRESTVSRFDDKTISGVLRLDRADVEWTLSADASLLPKATVDSGERAYRLLSIDGKDIDFSSGFTDLHTVTYNNILNGNGFSLDDAAKSLHICQDIMQGLGTIKY